MKPDERDLLMYIRKHCGEPGKRILPYKAAEFLGIPQKRYEYIFEKWADKGWWEYGTYSGSGWLEPKGIEAADELLEAVPTTGTVV